MNTGANEQEKSFGNIDLRRATAKERMSWGSRIRDLRIAQGMLQAELADAAGVSRRTVVSIESGTVAGQADKLARMLRILGVESEQRQYSDFTEQQVAIIAPLLDAIPEARRGDVSSAILKMLADAIAPSTPQKG